MAPQNDNDIIAVLLVITLINLVVLVHFHEWLQYDSVVYLDCMNGYKIIMRLL